jgi:alcohol dehydrogenase (cytochrome c)
MEDYRNGYYSNIAPLVADGKVLVGHSGGERGVRGFVLALDAETGKQAWKTFMVPEPGQPGSETWPKNDAWKTGGGSTWITGNYDPATKLVYWGTGNGGPWMGDTRPGDNLYTTSVVALDVATGSIKGHHQYHGNDSFDWDEVDPPILVDFERNGRKINGLVHAARSGVLFMLERTPEGKINFVDGPSYVYTDWIKSMDPKTGRIEYKEGAKPGTGVTGNFCPSFWGGKDWPAMAFSPQTNMLYIPVNENICSEMIGKAIEYEPGRPFTGTEKSQLVIRKGADHLGEVQAWDLNTGKMVWQHKFPKSQNWGSLLATGGGLVFGGGTNDRFFRAFDAKTGEVLWEQRLNSGVIGVPSSFEADGKQYIAVQSGWGIDAAGMQTRLSQLLPDYKADVPLGGVIWVFEVK